MKTMNKYLWSAKISGHLPFGLNYILVFTETNVMPGLDADGHRGFCLRSQEQQTPLVTENSLQSEQRLHVR